jgi:hypothetical protein
MSFGNIVLGRIVVGFYKLKKREIRPEWRKEIRALERAQRFWVKRGSSE